MALTSFPSELQYEFLLDQPYETILSYCQVDRQASAICESELFWKLRLQRDGEDPRLLDLIDGPTPAIRYRTLLEILNSDISDAIRLGQSRWIKKMWSPEDPGNLSPGAIFEAIEKGRPEVVELLQNLIMNRSNLPPDEAANIFSYLITAAMQYAIEEERADIALYLRPIAGRTHLNLLEMIPGIFGPDPKLIEAIIADAKAQGQEKIVQDFAEVIMGDHPEVLTYLLENHPEKLDLEELFQIALEDCPVAQQIYDQIKLRSA